MEIYLLTRDNHTVRCSYCCKANDITSEQKGGAILEHQWTWDLAHPQVEDKIYYNVTVYCTCLHKDIQHAIDFTEDNSENCNV